MMYKAMGQVLQQEGLETNSRAESVIPVHAVEELPVATEVIPIEQKVNYIKMNI